MTKKHRHTLSCLVPGENLTLTCKVTGESAARKTKLDLILDGVRRGKSEVTIDTDGYTRDQVSRIITTAKGRGLSAAYDGRFVLVRDL